MWRRQTFQGSADDQQERAYHVQWYGTCYTGKEIILMPNLEDRVMTLERKVAMLELLRSQDERNVEEGFPPAQARNMRDINENITTLLGITSRLGGDVKEIKEHVSDMKERLQRLETLANEHTRRFEQIDALLMRILARLPEKP
jgi:hypothetical protein